MENNMHRPRYSLPPQAIVGGRYLVREFLEEQENQLVYLAYDLVEKAGPISGMLSKGTGTA